MLEALKSLLNLAGNARRDGDRDEAERLYKEAAEEARANDAVARAEALLGTAQIRRDRGDRTGASIYYSEAIALLRSEYGKQPDAIASTFAYALRHAADVRSELGEFSVAGSHIHEAVRLYRALDPVPALDLANALRVEALNNEREAVSSWTEAEVLYTEAAVSAGRDVDTDAGISEARTHLNSIQKIAPERQTDRPASRRSA